MYGKFSRLVMLVLCACLFTASGAFAAWPERPITLIVPFGAGGSTDIPARLLAHMLEKKLGQPVVVQNIAGAGGTQGVAQAAAAQPDGYTYAYAPTGTMCLQPHLQRLPYGVDDFDFIGMVMNQPVVVMADKSAPFSTMEEFVELAKKEPGKYVAGITGAGNMTHLPLLNLAKHYGIKLRYIPYRNGSEIFKDMMAGRTHIYADAPAALSTFNVRGLTQFAPERADNLPDIPTAREQGLDASYAHWQGIIAPKDIPAEAKQKMEKALEEIVTSPEFKAEAEKMKTRAYWMPSAQFQDLYRKELADYKAILQENGMLKQNEPAKKQ